MSNPFYNYTSGAPVAVSRGTSSPLRNEFTLLAQGFDAINAVLAYSTGQVWTGAQNFTGATITVPTKSQGDNSLNAASTAYVDTGLATEIAARIAGDSAEQARALAAEALLAPKASPALTGVPTAPTASFGSAGTQVATLDFANALAFATALPAQTGSAGKTLITDGVNASWGSTAAMTTYAAQNFGGF